MVNFLNFDEKRKVLLADDHQEFLHLTAADWITEARQSVRQRDAFFVALSGGKTPQAIFDKICKEKEFLPESKKIFLFWSDERDVPSEHTDSNYRNAMEILSDLKIPEENIFKMRTDENPETSAFLYEKLILEKVPEGIFDLVMLGVGKDGHTASLFPETTALQEKERFVVANAIPELKTTRITLSFPCIIKSRQIAVYVSGDDKKEIVDLIFQKDRQNPSFPVDLLTGSTNPIKWFVDHDAYSNVTFAQ